MGGIEDYYTYNEILRQPETWRNIYKDIVEEKHFDYGLFENKYDEIILFGCGSSYNLGICASFFTKSIFKDITCCAIPSSEILLNKDLYININKKYLLIGFSRSGETTESVEVVNSLKNRNNVRFHLFSCSRNSFFSKNIFSNYICSNKVEKSIVMTESFSSMLLAYCLILSVIFKNKKLISDFDLLIEDMVMRISAINEFTDNFITRNKFLSFFVLGSGLNYGLAVEADLKMKEMSQVPSYSYHIHEFNHGPKSLLDKNSMCLILYIDGKTKQYKDLLKEYNSLGARLLIINDEKIQGLDDTEGIEYFMLENNIRSNLVKSFINIPFFQFMAFFKTINNNLDPDKPNNLKYTVFI